MMNIITLEALRDTDEFEAKVAKAKAYIARDLAKRQRTAAQEQGR